MVRGRLERRVFATKEFALGYSKAGGIWINAVLPFEAASWQVFIYYLGLSLGLVVR